MTGKPIFVLAFYEVDAEIFIFVPILSMRYIDWCSERREDGLALSDVVQCTPFVPLKYCLLIELPTSVTLSCRIERSALGNNRLNR